MSGLVWSALGQGISSLGNTMGSMMAREADREDRQEEQRRRDEERRAYEMQRDALYKRTAEQQAAGKGGGDGLSAQEIGEGGKDEGMLARRAGMTVPELRGLRRLSETGDTESFKQDVTRYKPEVEGEDTTDAVSRKYAKQMGLTETVKELPPGFEAEARAKMQALAKIEESYRLGGKYDDVTRGRQNQLALDLAQGVVGGKMDAERASQAVGVMSGKPMRDIKDHTEFSPYIAGQRQTTDVGKAEIAKDTAQAERARREPTGKNEDLQTLQDMRKAAQVELADARKALTEFDKLNTGDLSRPGREKLKEQRDALAAEVTSARDKMSKVSDRLNRRLDEVETASKPAAASKPAPAPAAGGGLPEPKTPEEVARLKPGTRFRAPDGSIRYR